MQRNTSFLEYVTHDVLGHIPHVTAKSMFGGWGIYSNGIIFAIIADGELFFKADEASARLFASGGSRQFTYTSKKHTKPISMSYWSVPEEIMENQEQCNIWANAAIAASHTKKNSS